MKLLVSILLFYLSSVAGAQPLDVWVDYDFAEYHRANESDQWKLVFSGPFGVRIPVAGGFVSRDSEITNPEEPNCFRFGFNPISTDDLKSLSHVLEITKYAGDQYCSPRDQKKIIQVASFETTALQGKTATIVLPYLAGKQVKYELSQTWKVVP